ncbi:cupredoxin domain-containing protein [Sulfitobacter sp.]|uniref:cupredoxin domain-containing protein n=1 Tax=Sulfitobacter sp. TaxID=1903071 RepID=UPI00405830FC
MKNLLLTTALTISLAAPAFAAGKHEAGHGDMKMDDHAAMMVGMPGDASKVDRTIDVTLLENDEGQMLIESEDLSFKKGETVRFKVANKGEIEHEFVLDTVERNAEHKEEMMEMAGMDMKHSDPNRLLLDAGASAEVVWTFTNDGTYEAACLIPGHYESGMHREVSVGK